MTSKVTNLKEEDNITTFTISSTDVSYVNALRRTILSEIPIVVFKTTPYEENKANIIANTTRLNNEIIKQRLSCIPICITDLDMPIKNYLLEINVENKTDTVMYVTTKDFKIKDLTTNNYLDEGVLRKIFPSYVPPSGKGEYFIDFVRLRPKISDEIPGEKIKMTCEFSIGTAKEDGMFNVTGTCSYGCTPDYEKIEEQLEIRKQKWKDEGKKVEEIEFEAKNWKLLEGMRYVKPKSFDFILETVGIYENVDIIIKACNILKEKFIHMKTLLDQDELKINASENTLLNCYDVILENEDYTVGNILNYVLYTIFYVDLKMLDYVGFKKLHPHDNDSIVRMSLVDKTKGISTVKTILTHTIETAIKTINSMRGCFDGTRETV
jgi:DNA-directed RNA polymerase subunit L